MNHPLKTKTLLFLLVLLTISSSVFSFVYLENNFLIRKWNIPTSTGGFWDARQMAIASESYAMGYDPLVENPANPNGQKYNYPRIWHQFFKMGIDQTHTNLIGTITVLIFFAGAALFWFSRDFDTITAMILSLVMLSPAVMLGIERANLELVLFAILSLALVIDRFSVISSLFLFVFAAVLKLHPVFGFVYLLKEDKKRFWILLLCASAVFALYALLSLSDFTLIFKTTPKVVGSSFGVNVWWMGISHPRFFGLSLSESTSLTLKSLSYAAAALMFLTALIMGIRRKETSRLDTARHINAFRTGAGIYLGCFLLMNTIDYRMVFLVFAVPQLAEWMRSGERDISRASTVGTVAMLVSLWSFFLMRFLGRNITFVIEESCNWILAACLLYLFFSSLPKWFRDYLRGPLQRRKLSNDESIRT